MRKDRIWTCHHDHVDCNEGILEAEPGPTGHKYGKIFQGSFLGGDHLSTSELKYASHALPARMVLLWYQVSAAQGSHRCSIPNA